MSRIQRSGFLLSIVAALTIANQAFAQIRSDDPRVETLVLSDDLGISTRSGLGNVGEMTGIAGPALRGEIVRTNGDGAEPASRQSVLPAPEPSGVVLIVIALLCVIAMHIRKPIDGRDDHVA
jgi:hypothetical protein